MSKCNGVFVTKTSSNESVDSLIKRFKKKIKLSKVLQIKIESEVYIKPSKKKRLKKAESLKKKRNSNIDF